MANWIEYCELSNGDVLKRMPSGTVYRFNPMKEKWERILFPMGLLQGKSWGAPCEHLRNKADILCDLPSFPAKADFYPENAVLIGAFPQYSSYDFSSVEWIVLEVTGATALCISKDSLLTSHYCDPERAYGNPDECRWEKSKAREMCNLFYEEAFSEAEKARIIPHSADTYSGSTVADPVFILSENEVRRYFPSVTQKKAKPTRFAIENGASLGWTEDTKEYTSWWILPEDNPHGIQNGSVYPKAVFQNGEIQFHGRNIYHGDFTIRPCITIAI